MKRVYKQVELDTYQHLTEATEIMSTNIEEPLRKLKRLFHRYFKINPAAVLHKPEAWLERPPATSGSPELTTN